MSVLSIRHPEELVPYPLLAIVLTLSCIWLFLWLQNMIKSIGLREV